MTNHPNARGYCPAALQFNSSFYSAVTVYYGRCTFTPLPAAANVTFAKIGANISAADAAHIAARRKEDLQHKRRDRMNMLRYIAEHPHEAERYYNYTPRPKTDRQAIIEASRAASRRRMNCCCR